MSETSHASAVSRAAYVPMVQPNLPGLDDDRVADIYASMSLDFDPKDQIEAWWMNDIAHITARIDHLRMSLCGYYFSEMKSTLLNTSFMVERFDMEERDVLSDLSKRGFKLDKDEGPHEAAILQRFISVVTINESHRTMTFLEMERNLLRERDRVFAQFEKRKRDRIVEAVQAIEVPKTKMLPSLT